jgi:hypothetical protein
MRAKVAVATVQGKAYYLIVNELKRRQIPFVSLIPGDSVSAEIRAVITTKQEKRFILHHKTVVYDPEMDPELLGAEVVRILRGREIYENIVIGVDPGDVFGVAVLADAAVIDTENCDSIRGTINHIKNTLRTVSFSGTTVAIKIGSGVPVYKELLDTLDVELPPQVVLEIVREEGTTRYAREDKHRRGFRHMTAAIRIAGRAGHIYERRNGNEQDD